MEKLIVRTALIAVFLFPLSALSATYNACADSGTCNSYNTYPGNASGGNLGAYQPGYVPGGGMGGGPSPEDLAKKEKAEQEGKKKYCKDNGYPAHVPFCAAFKEEERIKKVRECKMESVGLTKLCNEGAVAVNERDSRWCSGAKWLGGAFGVLGGWAYYEGEGAGAVLLAGAGMVMYQRGDDCQTDMDRVMTASLANCTTEQTKRDLNCDAIK